MSLRRALLFSTGERYFGLLVNFASIAIVSRYLTPEQVGLMGFGMALTNLIEMIRDLGATSFVIQARDSDRDASRTAFTIMAILTLIVVVPMFVAATPLARIYGDDRAANLLAVLALSYLPGPFLALPFALMRREMSFGTTALLGIGGITTSSVLTIAFVFLDFGHLSYAFAVLCANVVLLAMTVVARPDLCWVFRPTLRRFREVFSFGGYSALSGLMLAFNEFLPNLYIGRLLGLDALGHFNRAFVMFSLPDKLLLTGFAPVALPAFSALSRDGHSLKAAYLRGLEMVSAVKMPVHILLAILAAPAVRILLGPKWSGVVPLLQIMSMTAIFTYPFALAWPVLVAAGEIRSYMRALMIAWPIAAGAMFIAANISLTALAWAWGIAGMAFTITKFVYLRQAVGATWSEVFAHVRKTLIVSGISMALPAVAYLAFDPISIPLSIGVGGVAIVGWWVGIRVTDHPLLAEVNRALDAALRIPGLQRLAARLPTRLRSAVAVSTGRDQA